MIHTKKAFCFIVILAALIFSTGIIEAMADTAAECPEVMDIQNKARDMFKKDVEVVGVLPTKVPGLCEVRAKLQNKYNVLYVDVKGEYMFIGNVYEIATKNNLTKETLEVLNRLSDSDMKRVEDLVIFTIGDKGKTFYIVTDPDCPYCEKAYPLIKSMADSGKITVKFLLYPLSFHKEAKKKTIAIICDNKGLPGLEAKYVSENQCEDGTLKVEKTTQLMNDIGVRGTPTYIFDDGRIHSGVITSEDDLLKKINETSGSSN